MPISQIIKMIAIMSAILLQVACVVEVRSDSSGGHHVSRVFGGIDVEEGEHMGDLDSVNGGIQLEDNSSAEDIETVNGGVKIQDDVTVYSIETVNGGVRAGRNLTVRDDISTVNGGIDLSKGSSVEGDVNTVNGSIKLRATKVGRDVETTNGDIYVEDGSVVEGDVIFGEVSDHWWNRNDRPSLYVDKSSEIKGDIHLYREVKLRIEDGASVGDIVEHY
jgi:hypothetical protein